MCLYGYHRLLPFILKYKKYFLSSITNVLKLAFAHILLLSHVYNILWISHSLIIASIIGYVMMIVVYIKLKHTKLVTSLCLRTPIIWSRMNRTIAFNIRTSWYIHHINKTIGSAFIIYLAFNCPISCLILYEVFQGASLLKLRILFAIVIVQHVLLIFAIHFMFVYCNLQFANLVKPLLNQIGRMHPQFPTRNLLRQSLYLQTFHTKKGYGFSYGKLGLMTFKSFAKVRPSFSKFFKNQISKQNPTHIQIPKYPNINPTHIQIPKYPNINPTHIQIPNTKTAT